MDTPLAEVSLAEYNGMNNLQTLDGGADAATADSGQPILSASGQISESSVKSSNVDIADQFSQLVVAQHAYPQTRWSRLCFQSFSDGSARTRYPGDHARSIGITAICNSRLLTCREHTFAGYR